jgi:hypothetical protein
VYLLTEMELPAAVELIAIVTPSEPRVATRWVLAVVVAAEVVCHPPCASAFV